MQFICLEIINYIFNDVFQWNLEDWVSLQMYSVTYCLSRCFSLSLSNRYLISMLYLHEWVLHIIAKVTRWQQKDNVAIQKDHMSIK